MRNRQCAGFSAPNHDKRHSRLISFVLLFVVFLAHSILVGVSATALALAGVTRAEVTGNVKWDRWVVWWIAWWKDEGWYLICTVFFTVVAFVGSVKFSGSPWWVVGLTAGVFGLSVLFWLAMPQPFDGLNWLIGGAYNAAEDWILSL